MQGPSGPNLTINKYFYFWLCIYFINGMNNFCNSDEWARLDRAPVTATGGWVRAGTSQNPRPGTWQHPCIAPLYHTITRGNAERVNDITSLDLMPEILCCSQFWRAWCRELCRAFGIGTTCLSPSRRRHKCFHSSLWWEQDSEQGNQEIPEPQFCFWFLLDMEV